MNRKSDRYASAWAHVALCADTAWAPDPVDAFSRANQQLWYNHCHSVNDFPDSQTNLLALTSARNRTDSNIHVSCSYCKNAGQGSLLNVKDVIPQSRLSKFYGNFYYDEVRESCFTNGQRVQENRTSERTDTLIADAVEECWMLPEVETLFKTLTEDETGESCQPVNEYSSDAAAESLWQSLRAPTSRACQKTQNTTNRWSQLERNVVGSVSRAPASDGRAVRFDPEFACSCYSRAPGSGASFKLTYVPVNKDIDISKNRFDVETQEEIALKSRVCSSRIRAIWPVAVKHPRDSRKIRTRHRPRPPQKTLVRRKSPNPILVCPKPTVINNIRNMAPHRPKELYQKPKQVSHVRQHARANIDPNKVPSKPKNNIATKSFHNKMQKPLNNTQKVQGAGVRIYSSDQELHKKKLRPEFVRNVTPTRSIEMRDVRVLLEQLKRRSDAARLLVNTPQIHKQTAQLPQVEVDNNHYPEAGSMSHILRSPLDGDESPKVSPNNIQKRLYSTVLIEKAQGDDGLDQLEKEAIEQYKASDESIDTQYRELERQALEQYSGTSLRGGNEKAKNGKARAAAARRSGKASKRVPRPRVHAGGDLPAARAPIS